MPVSTATWQERMRRLEALRLELDSRRRTVADLQGRCERVRANLGTTRARGEVDMELTLRKMQHKEDKMQRTASQFQEMEQTVYNSLFTLIKDTCVLRDYAAAALLIVNVRTYMRRKRRLLVYCMANGFSFLHPHSSVPAKCKNENMHWTGSHLHARTHTCLSHVAYCHAVCRSASPLAMRPSMALTGRCSTQQPQAAMRLQWHRCPAPLPMPAPSQTSTTLGWAAASMAQMPAARAARQAEQACTWRVTLAQQARTLTSTVVVAATTRMLTRVEVVVSAAALLQETKWMVAMALQHVVVTGLRLLHTEWLAAAESATAESLEV
jgi:hypothetical protein